MAACRLRPARCVVDDGRPLRRAAERFQVGLTTAARRAGCCRQQGGAGMQDRRCRPHHQPRRTPAAVEAQVAAAAARARLGPVVWIVPASRGLARTSAALSSVANSPALGCARAGGPP
ncbi:leucine zipper domain-containing protein, partial [Streptomyces flaveolus]